MKPSHIILYEPQLEIMRCIEVFNAHRVLDFKSRDFPKIEVNLIMFEESSEFYQYMSLVDEEKLGFKKLIDIKEKLFIELKDFKLE